MYIYFSSLKDSEVVRYLGTIYMKVLRSLFLLCIYICMYCES